MLANAFAQIVQFFQSYGALAVLAVILAVGIWRLIASYVSARAQTNTTTAFRQRFDAFVNSSGEDTQAYERLAFLAERMGNVMGRYALAESKPPFAAHSGKTYATVLQYIPELRRHFADERHVRSAQMRSTKTGSKGSSSRVILTCFRASSPRPTRSRNWL